MGHSVSEDKRTPVEIAARGHSDAAKPVTSWDKMEVWEREFRAELMEAAFKALKAAGYAVVPIEPMTIPPKAAYVVRQRQTRKHECHWPGCTMQVPPAMWGCRPHWFALPKALRDKVWRSYRPGQEVDGRPSREYVEAAREVQTWIENHSMKKDGPLT
jgi:hypothetical protein